MNHLWPLRTHSSPVADRGGGEVGGIGAGVVGFGQRERGIVLAGEQRFEPPLLLLLGADRGEDLAVAGIRCLAAEHERTVRCGTQDLLHQAQLHLAVSLSTEFRVEVCGPQVVRLDLFL